MFTIFRFPSISITIKYIKPIKQVLKLITIIINDQTQITHKLKNKNYHRPNYLSEGNFLSSHPSDRMGVVARLENEGRSYRKKKKEKKELSNER
jgi:hypothetical protein